MDYSKSDFEWAAVELENTWFDDDDQFLKEVYMEALKRVLKSFEGE